MFTNIPVSKTVNLITDLLKQKNIPLVVIDEFWDLITQCTKKNLCVFRGTTYVFPDGLPMGGPLSMLLAAVFIDHLETEILRGSPHNNFAYFWARYVDDILCIWTGSAQAIQLFLHELNEFDPGINFSLEFGDQSINFLDLGIELKELYNLLTPVFRIYRKDTFTGVSIHSESLHPGCHKHAAINAAINRVLRIPRPKG